ncbi:ATP-binding protein [Streptomyces sp. NPDC058953]|uniref:ATP-binding protein n=1 Tax=unclassified Streptomyces TaxID=2593676 RepID=UPI0036AF6400
MCEGVPGTVSLPGLDALRALPRRLVLTLPAAGSSVRVARENAEQALAEWGIGPRHPVADPALLILTELVANSVRHAAALSPTVTVVLGAGPETLAVGVHDRHPERPVLSARRTGPGGGLATVLELTLELGGTASVLADPEDSGKTVWISLPL